MVEQRVQIRFTLAKVTCIAFGPNAPEKAEGPFFTFYGQERFGPALRSGWPSGQTEPLKAAKGRTDL